MLIAYGPFCCAARNKYLIEFESRFALTRELYPCAPIFRPLNVLTMRHVILNSYKQLVNISACCCDNNIFNSIQTMLACLCMNTKIFNGRMKNVEEFWYSEQSDMRRRREEGRSSVLHASPAMVQTVEIV